MLKPGREMQTKSRGIENKFLNSVEISAQEAVYIIRQLPMRKSSRNVIFVNTSPPTERVDLLKPLSEIEKMSDESEEIHSGGLKRYVERPDILQHITLADWAAWYDTCGQNNYRKTNKKQILIAFQWKQRMRIMMMNYLIMKIL